MESNIIKNFMPTSIIYTLYLDNNKKEIFINIITKIVNIYFHKKKYSAIINKNVLRVQTSTMVFNFVMQKVTGDFDNKLLHLLNTADSFIFLDEMELVKNKIQILNKYKQNVIFENIVFINLNNFNKTISLKDIYKNLEYCKIFVLNLFEKLEENIPITLDYDLSYENSMLFIFSAKQNNKGNIVVKGICESGGFKIGQKVFLNMQDKKVVKIITNLQVMAKNVNTVKEGEFVEMGLRGLEKNEIANSNSIVMHNSKPCNHFYCSIVLCDNLDSKLEINSKQFLSMVFRDGETIGKVNIIHKVEKNLFNKMVYCHIELDRDIFFKENEFFYIKLNEELVVGKVLRKCLSKTEVIDKYGLKPVGSFIENNKTTNSKETINLFYIGEQPVTVKQYLEYIKSFPQFNNDLDNIKNKDISITKVNWHNAKGYCKWLTKKTGFKFRLPSEKEWEFANNLLIFQNSSLWEWCEDSAVMYYLLKEDYYELNGSGNPVINVKSTKAVQKCNKIDSISSTTSRRAKYKVSLRGDVGFRVVMEV